MQHSKLIAMIWMVAALSGTLVAAEQGTPKYDPEFIKSFRDDGRISHITIKEDLDIARGNCNNSQCVKRERRNSRIRDRRHYKFQRTQRFVDNFRPEVSEDLVDSSNIVKIGHRVYVYYVHYLGPKFLGNIAVASIRLVHDNSPPVGGYRTAHYKMTEYVTQFGTHIYKKYTYVR